MWIVLLTLTAACGRDHVETPSPVPVVPPATSPAPEEPRPTPGQPGFTLSGQVRATPLNEAVSGAQIDAMHDGAVVATTSSSPDGTYRMTGLSAQDYVLRVIKTGYTVNSIDVLVSGDTTRDIVMDRNRVTVQGFVNRALPCNAFIDGVRVEILDGPDAGKFDFSGIAVRYRIQNVVWGTFRMRASKPGFRTLETSVTVPPPAAATGGIFETYFRLGDEIGTNTVTGEVSNRMIETGGQINDAQVSITLGPNTGRSTTSGSAGGAGLYSLTGLLDGEAYVAATKPGFNVEAVYVEFCGNLRVDLKMVPTDASFSGVVRNENGELLAGARVEKLSPGSSIPTGMYVMTDGKGEYTMTGLAGDFLRIRVSKAGYLSEDRKLLIRPHMDGDFTLKRAP
ncbi:MAG TPA: carboxypeptidase-like regulatory domain-containing protein [Vicinamibacterales bacterium]|nr:carboxypeptidase-like regulatory domain-containing protein [Vicinamibacterales bacterium]